MPAALWLALTLLSGSLPLLEETVEVPPGEWREVGITLRQRPAVVDCRFEVVSGRSGVRLALVPRSELERLRAQKRHRVLFTTGYSREGRFRVPAATGDYSLVIDNRLDGREPARVELAVALLFPPDAGQPRELPAARRNTVVAVSLAFFAAVAGYTLWKLRHALRDRPQEPPPPFWM
jgi:hypothetical protein